MHVKVTTVRGDKRTYRYLSLVESRRVGGKVRHEVVARLGEADELARSGELARLVDALGAHLGAVGAKELSCESAPSIGAVSAAHSYFARLGLDAFFDALGARRRSRHLADTVFAMVANRLCDPASKRRAIVDWLGHDVVLPEGIASPSLDQCYRALDALCRAKDELEAQCYAAVCDLTNLDLRLVCYDLTSTYFEGQVSSSERFSSRAFGYSRDKRGDRPQVVIGLLVTGDGIPIAHHVFSGNTGDTTTLPTVLSDLQERFGVGRIALVCDRGLVSEANLQAVGAAGFDHVIATRLHRDPEVQAALARANERGVRWRTVDQTTKATDVVVDGTRYVVVDSFERHERDALRLRELLVRTEDALVALANRVAAGRLSDPAKIGAAADRVLHDSGVARCFTTTIRPGSFSWDFDAAALRYETELLEGRYVLVTSLGTKTASAVEVVRHYKALQLVERRFRVLKDFLALRPVYHFTESRVRGHVALCVLAAVVEAVMGKDLASAGVMDPDVDDQVLTPRRALRHLARIRAVRLVAHDGTERRIVTRPDALHAQVLDAMRVDTSAWNSRLSG